MAFIAPMSAARAIHTVRPEIVCDPFGSYSSFALPGWGEPNNRAIHTPMKLVAVDDESVDWSRGQRSLLEISERAARTKSTVTLTFRDERRTATMQSRLVHVEARSLLTILLYHCAIALCLLSSAGIVATLARGRSGVRAYTTLAIAGTTFLCTFLEYHLSGSFAPLFLAAYGGTALALSWLAWSFPREPSVSPRARAAALVAFVAFAVFSAAVSLAAFFFRSPMWARETLNFATMLSLLALASGVLMRLRSSSGRERAALKSALLGFVGVPVVIVLTQGLALVGGARLTHVVVPLGGVSIPLSIGYALVRHNAFESRVVVRRSQLALPIAGMAASTLLAIAALVAALPSRAGAALVAAFASVASFVLVFAVFRRATERYLFPTAPQYQPLISSLSDRVSRVARREEVIEAIQSMLRETHNIGGAEVLSDAEIDGLASVVRDKLLRGESHWEGPSFDSQRLLVPMVSHEQLRAVLSVTPRGAKLLSSDDVALISTVASLGAVALHHAQVVAEIQELRALERSVTTIDRDTVVTTLAGEVLHELQTPLHFLRTVMHSSPDGDRAQLEENIEIAREEVARLERLVASARRMQLPSLGREPFALLDGVRSVLTVLRGAGREGLRDCEVSIPEGLKVRAERDRLRQVFVNLLRNATDAIEPQHGKVGVRATRAEDGRLEIDVWDNGPGVDPEIEAQLFRAFRSTRPNGTGLGLVVCAKVTRELGWDLSYVREDDKTVFRISVPASDVIDSADVSSEGEASLR